MSAPIHTQFTPNTICYLESDQGNSSITASLNALQNYSNTHSKALFDREPDQDLLPQIHVANVPFRRITCSLRSVEGSRSYDHCKEGFACLTSDAAVRMGAGVRFLGHEQSALTAKKRFANLGLFHGTRGTPGTRGTVQR